MPHRVRHQLAIQASPELLDRLRTAAAAQRRTATSLALEWIEAGLDGRLTPSNGPGHAALVARLDALEAAVAALQQQPGKVSRPSPDRVSRPAAPAAAAAPTSEPPAGALTTTDLATLLGITRAAMNSAIQRAGGGAVGRLVRGWRCVGQWPSGAGGAAPWWWVPDTDT